jgi:hypothetical protein
MGRLPRKISHVRFFHGEASQKNFSREIFSRGGSVEKNGVVRRIICMAGRAALPSLPRGGERVRRRQNRFTTAKVENKDEKKLKDG